MNIASTLLLALAMSTDAFAAAIGKGAALHKPKFREALKTGLIFGAIEAITPLIGWLLGKAAAQYVTAWDHWIAFTLLLILGARMIMAGTRKPIASIETAETPTNQAQPKNSHSLWVLAFTGFATSIDAMAVGASLAFIDVNIFSTAATIGLATMIMVTIGVMLGRMLGAVIGRRAETAGGAVLIIIGFTILGEHLGWLA